MGKKVLFHSVLDFFLATCHQSPATKDLSAFFFDQKGLMGGIGLQGTKITKIKK